MIIMYQNSGISELKDRKKKLEEQLDALDSEDELAENEESQVREQLKAFRGELKDKKSFGAKQVIIEHVKEIIIHIINVRLLHMSSMINMLHLIKEQ